MEPTDIQLMLRAQQGDLEAYRTLVERYRGPLKRFLAAMLGDQTLAEDAAQETLLRLWLGAGRYEPTGKFSTYLFQIARNHALNVKKRLAGQSALQPPVPVGEPTPERALLHRERAAEVEAAIQALPAIYRSVFEMSHRDGLKYTEIASQLLIPAGTVKSRMAEAVRRLRLALTPNEGDD
jgi:RNA polymerase sigma-70 factor, ECF subfamily